MWIIIIIIIWYILIRWWGLFETFDVVPQNSNNVKVQNSDILKARNDLYNSLLVSVYRNGEEMVDAKYSEFPSNFVFGYNKVFKDVLLGKLKTILGDADVRIVRDIDKIFWKDLGDTRRFVFETEFGSKEFIHLTKVYLDVNNISKYGLITGTKVLDNPVVQLDLEDININSIKIVKKEDNMNQNVQPYDSNTYRYLYRIRNRFGLMDPFVTDGKDMQIYENMKENFIKVLSEKNK
jgi:hypothetical protein